MHPFPAGPGGLHEKRGIGVASLFLSEVAYLLCRCFAFFGSRKEAPHRLNGRSSASSAIRVEGNGLGYARSEELCPHFTEETVRRVNVGAIDAPIHREHKSDNVIARGFA